MSDLTNSLNIQHKLPGLPRIIFLGIILGIAVSVMTISCLAAISLFLEGIPKFFSSGQIPFFGNSTWDSKSLLFVVFIIVLNVLAFAASVFVPTCVGGGLVALILQRLAHDHRLTEKTALIVGAFVGFGMGWVAAVTFLPMISVSAQWEPRVDPLLGGLVGTVPGLFHSWLLGHWLRKRVT